LKIVREHIVLEGYGAGFSMSAGGSFTGGMGGTTRGGFGGAWNSGGPTTMYTYEIKPLNHTLEPRPSANPELHEIQIGSKIAGYAVRSNATPDNKRKYKGIVRSIVTTNDNALKFYIIQDEATQKSVKIEPLSARLLINEPIEYYYDATDTQRSRRKEKLKNIKNESFIVREKIEII